MRNNNSFSGFDWEKWNQSSYQPPIKKRNPAFSMDFNWLENIIEKSIDKAFSSNPVMQKSDFTPHYRIKETHDGMIIKIPVPEHTNVKDIRIFLDKNELMITGIDQLLETIKLPHNGTITGSQANYQEKVLEIHIPNNEKKNFQEIKITNHDHLS